jgi:CO/xanthine dehydrogenase Mo-binding subunit
LCETGQGAVYGGASHWHSSWRTRVCGLPAPPRRKLADGYHDTVNGEERAEEFTWGYLRPAAVIDVTAGADAHGRVTAWSFTNINSGQAGIGCPYRVPHQCIAYQPADSPLPQGSYRALASTANNFARESHMDELARRCGADPVEFRLRHLDDERLAAVLRAAADRAGWDPRVTAQPAGQERPGQWAAGHGATGQGSPRWNAAAVRRGQQAGERRAGDKRAGGSAETARTGLGIACGTGKGQLRRHGRTGARGR